MTGGGVTGTGGKAESLESVSRLTSLQKNSGSFGPANFQRDSRRWNSISGGFAKSTELASLAHIVQGSRIAYNVGSLCTLALNS